MHLLGCIGWGPGYSPGQVNHGSECVWDGSKRRQCCCWLTSGGFWALSLFLVTSPTSHMQLAPLQLLSWLWFLEWVGLLMYHQFLPLPQTPLGLQLEIVWLFFTSARALGFMVWPGTGITCSQGVPMVLSTTCECGAAPSTSQAVSPPLYLSAPSLPLPHQVLSACLPVSVPPAHLGEYNFFKALVVRLLYSSGCFGGCFSGSSWCFSSLS